MISVQSTPLTAEELLILQNQAIEILAKCNPKPVIAFDLDYTIWPTNCYEQTMPPYYPSNPRSLSPPVEDRVFCHNPKEPGEVIPLAMYPQARGILDFCASNHIAITVVSRSPSAQFVQSILEAFGIWDWFLFPQVFYTRTKTYHFRNLVDVTHFDFCDFLLFDDESANVKSCGAIGVNCCLVDRWVGLTWDTFLRGLGIYRDGLAKRSSVPRSLQPSDNHNHNNSGTGNSEERSDHTVPYNHLHHHQQQPVTMGATPMGSSLRLPPLLPSNSTPRLVSPRTPVSDNRDIVLHAVDIQRIVSSHHAKHALSRPGSSSGYNSSSLDSPKVGMGMGSAGLLVINPPSPMLGMSVSVAAREAATQGDSTLLNPTTRQYGGGGGSHQGSRRNSSAQQTMTLPTTSAVAMAIPPLLLAVDTTATATDTSSTAMDES